jgi:hypothetical protein
MQLHPARGIYLLTRDAIAKATETILDLTRSQDPHRAPVRLARDLELAESHLQAALEILQEARALIGRASD